ncbi:Hypothetical protein SRAE_2000203800 [Strongyloides ratti]|uniref:Uncharacterized protein n=1 Tax=Strongyloides ratti TaxID=34506 RepID=A0A090MYL1_STRRB|nr:Hypothetical protein SRAE_2000203800 [Strongyloides ratti]CEF67374.1 Hypothetical protein SRAE_2000203800 [Strongyloides ratti]
MYFFRKNEIHVELLRVSMIESVIPQEMYLPNDKYKGIKYPCFNRNISLPQQNENKFILDNILLYTSSDEEFGYSFLYIKYNKIIYERLPFEGFVLTKEHLLLIDTKFDTETVIPASSLMIDGAIDNNKLGKDILLYNSGNKINNIFSNHSEGDMSFVPLIFSFIFLCLYIGMIIYFIYFCRQRGKKMEKFRVASTIIEKEWIAKTLSEIDENDKTFLTETNY